ncbi:hypothetical protein KE704_003402 [Salmonella enterica]|nr:hypothetical protein [Salmonella enterica]EHL8860480.1 hypothetical protein [Salmonella enterica]
MREKIKTPVVIINKRENSDSYAVAITNGSNNFHDGVLLVGVKPVEKNDRFAVFSMVGYYMAAEIERLRRRIDELESKSKFPVLPELGSPEINEAAWSLHNSLVANGPINASQFNNLKTSFYEALKVAVASNIEKTV